MFKICIYFADYINDMQRYTPSDIQTYPDIQHYKLQKQISRTLD